jgi:hypothetical protein
MMGAGPCYAALAMTAQKSSLSLLLCSHCHETCLFAESLLSNGRCLAMSVYATIFVVPNCLFNNLLKFGESSDIYCYFVLILFLIWHC